MELKLVRDLNLKKKNSISRNKPLQLNSSDAHTPETPFVMQLIDYCFKWIIFINHVSTSCYYFLLWYFLFLLKFLKAQSSDNLLPPPRYRRASTWALQPCSGVTLKGVLTYSVQAIEFYAILICISVILNNVSVFIYVIL